MNRPIVAKLERRMKNKSRNIEKFIKRGVPEGEKKANVAKIQEVGTRQSVSVLSGGRPATEGIARVVATTEAPVKRWYWDWDDWEIKFYWEVLVCKEGALDTRRMDSKGLTVFLNHKASDVKESVGVIESYQINEEDCRLEMDLRFDLNEETGATTFRKIKEGFLKNFSVGYAIDYSKSEMKEIEGEDWMFCKSWEPHEISVVGVNADRDAQVLETRGSDGEKKNVAKDVEVIQDANNTTKEIDMSKKNKDGEAPGASKGGETKVAASTSIPIATPPGDAGEGVKSPVCEKERRSEIFLLAKEFEINDLGKVQNLLDSKKTLDQIKIDILTDKVKAQESTGAHVKSDGEVLVGKDFGADAKKEYFSRELGAIMFGAKRKEMEGYKRNSEHHVSFHSLCRSHLVDSGVNIPKSTGDMIRSVLGVADFPLALADTVHREMYSIFESMAMENYKPLVMESMVPDFREKTLSTIGGTRSAKVTAEGAAVVYDAVLESGERASVSRYVKGMKLTYEMMVNDDVGLMQQVSRAIPESLSADANALFWDEFLGGRVGANAFFSGTNVHGMPAPLTNQNINHAYTFLKTRLMNPGHAASAGEKRALYLALPLSTLAVPPQLAGTAKSLLRDLSADVAAGVNVWANEITNLIISPYLGATTWYAFTDPMRVPGFFQLTLTGEPMLQVDSEVDFDTRCLKIKGELVTGFKALDRRAGLRFNTV